MLDGGGARSAPARRRRKHPARGSEGACRLGSFGRLYCPGPRVYVKNAGKRIACANVPR
jgi:hypothetical protein